MENLDNKIKNINIDIKETEEVNCDKCNNNTFNEVVMFRRISTVLSPNGKEGMLPITTFECASCGNVNKQFLPTQLRERDE